VKGIFVLESISYFAYWIIHYDFELSHA